MITKNFPYPPDPANSPDMAPENLDVNNTDSIHSLQPDSAKKVGPEQTPDTDVQPAEEEVSPISPADALTQGKAVHNTGGALSEGPSGNVMDNISETEPDFVKIRGSLLQQYCDVFKEDLSPSDRIDGVHRVEIDESGVKPLHFTTPKEVPIHLRKAADKELKRCLDAGQLEP